MSPAASGSGMFSTKKYFNLVSGFREDIHLAEDADFIRDIAKSGGKFKMIPITFIFDDRRLKKDGYLYTSLLYLWSYIYRTFTSKPYQDKKNLYQFGKHK
jgi:hypothetical protein